MLLGRIPEHDIFSVPVKGLKCNEFAKSLDMEISKNYTCVILKVWTWKLLKMTYVNNPKSNFLERVMKV